VHRRVCLYMWFRLIFIGGGGTFQKPGPFGARGWPTGPTTRSVGLVWAPSGSTSAWWVLDSSRCFFFRCKSCCVPEPFGDYYRGFFAYFLNSPYEFLYSPKLVEIVNINPNKMI
jgi:hypothetical protein